MRKYLTIILFALGAFSASSQEVIAHRGYHAKANGAHNSIGAFVAAIESGFTMSEFDIVRTSEGERIVAHGPKHGNMKISKSSLSVAIVREEMSVILHLLYTVFITPLV